MNLILFTELLLSQIKIKGIIIIQITEIEIIKNKSLRINQEAYNYAQAVSGMQYLNSYCVDTL